MSSPWMKFYPRDWRGDQALRAVSIAARGFWMECLCIMHEAKPYGHLVLNGAPVEGDTLARMTGVSVDEVSALLAELRQAGVLSVTGKGGVFSRRMVADHARANKGRKAAERRWSQTTVSTQENSAPIRSPNREPITQKPETRKKKIPKKSLGAHALPPDFRPAESLIAKAQQDGWSSGAIEYQIGRMRNWAEANGVSRKDWNAQLRNWLDGAVEKYRGQGPDPRTYAPSGAPAKPFA